MAWGCGGLLGLLGLMVGGLFLLLNRVPGSYPEVKDPIPPPEAAEQLGGGLEGFASPYLGHTGSWDGKGGRLGGKPKTNDLDLEVKMGLRWTFMPVYWRALEPEGPVEPGKTNPPAWAALDAFVAQAKARKLNILMQAPVVGGNAGGPPQWTGRREPGKSAPAKMAAAAEFAGKLAQRYAPGGTLARERGWGTNYGVRAWELDNEPDGYLTHWKGQAGDYAEFATLVAGKIKAADPQGVILAPGVMGGGRATPWVEATLDAQRLEGSPAYRQGGTAHSLGPLLDVVSFHVYEGLDSALAGKERTVEVAFGEVRDLFEKWERGAEGFHYARKRHYWHTEGNYDFLGVMSARRRAAWRMQFFTRAFAAGIRKVNVMDANAVEQAAVRAYVAALPAPFPMRRVREGFKVVRGEPVVYLHEDGQAAGAGRVWVMWAKANTGEAEVQVPCGRQAAEWVSTEGVRAGVSAADGQVQVKLRGDKKMAAPVLVIDRPGGNLSDR
jgi:hypothetical protein